MKNKLLGAMRSMAAMRSLAIIAVIAVVLAGCASMTLVSLEQDSIDGPKQVRQGYDINPRDITLYGLYKDDSRKLVNIRAGDIVFNKNTPGPQTVRIRISGQEASFQTEVMPLRTLTIASQPRTAIFKQGQEADRTWPGLEIRGEWASMGSDRIDIASCEVSGFNKDTVGRQTVRVSFQGQSATFNVEVRAMASIRIVDQPAKLTYYVPVDSALDLTGLRVVGVWEGLPEENLAITRNDVTGFDITRGGTQRLTITKNGRSATFNVEVIVPDPVLNGNWLYVGTMTGGGRYEVEMRFNNGNFEQATDGKPQFRGTYTAAGGRITITMTGLQFAAPVEEYGMVANRWYSKSDVERNNNIPDAGKQLLLNWFEPVTSSYAVTGNILVWTGSAEGARPQAYTKR